MKIRDAAVGASFVVAGAVVYTGTLGFPSLDDGHPGPALFPRILAVLMGLLGGALVAFGLRGGLHRRERDRRRVCAVRPRPARAAAARPLGLVVVLEHVGTAAGLLASPHVLFVMFEANGIPVAPVVLGLVLGPILAQNFMISMIKSDWDLTQFFTRPVSGLLGGVTVFTWFAPLLAPLVARWLAAGASAKARD